MRITIHGAGALGCYFGARLQNAGHDLCFVARGPHLEAMKTNGLLVEGSTGHIRLKRVRAVATIAEAGPADLVLFAVKNYDVEQAAADLAASINPEAAIMTVQNGVSVQPHLADKFGPDRILPGVVRLPADIKSPGVIRVPAEAEMGGLVFGAYDGKTSERSLAVFDAFTESGIGATLSDDIWRTLWEKFIPLSSFSAMTVMTRLDIGPVRKIAASRSLLRTLMDETAAVAQADHPSVPADAADAAYNFLMNVPPNVHASMLDDLLRGKKLELEWLSGEVIRRGKKLDVKTPAHEFAYAVLAPHADGRSEGQLK
jgi:2-dehydropantoate 2-reductase